MFLKRTLIAAAFVVGSAVAANAADPIMPAPPPPPPPAAPVFDWSGPYVGAYTGYLFGPGFLQVGAQAGYLWDLGGFVVGVEGQAGGGWAFPGLFGEANLNARAGYSFGSVLAYAEAGVGVLWPVTFTWNAGGGVEFAINNDMSLFVESKYYGTFGGGGLAIGVQGGLNWHF